MAGGRRRCRSPRRASTEAPHPHRSDPRSPAIASPAAPAQTPRRRPGVRVRSRRTRSVSPQEEARMAATETSTAPDALVERLFEGVLGMTEVYTVYMGDRLGLYEALADGQGTEAEIAAATNTNPR